MTAQVLSIISVLAVSLVSLIGLAALSMSEARLRKVASFFISFAVGGLLGDAFIHLIPETFSGDTTPIGGSLLILGGMLLFFAVEKLLRHRHGTLQQHHHHAHNHTRLELAAINVFGDAIHNFIDGALIGASYLASPTLGISTTAAVLLHEIPQEFGDFSILIHSGVSVRKAIWLNLASASVAVLGTVMTLLAGSFAVETVVTLLLPVTAGGFVYIAAANLIPELQEDRSLRALGAQMSLMAIGMGLMALLAVVELRNW
jgi:zinc and cadmium transporter